MIRDARRPNLLLKQARGALSQARLAELVNEEILRATGSYGAITAKSISDYERGWYTWPGQHARDALCQVLGASDAAALGFENRRASEGEPAQLRTPAPKAMALADLTERNGTGSVGQIDFGQLEVPGGRMFSGLDLEAHYWPAERAGPDRLAVSSLDDEATIRPDRRSTVVAVTGAEGEEWYHVADGRQFGQKPLGPDRTRYLPSANVLDDLTVAILWMITNTDAALLSDDYALDHYRTNLSHYGELPSSSLTFGEVPDLHELSARWLGSRFCADHVLRHLNRLTSAPVFWSREQRGEEASCWLIWTHKIQFLGAICKALKHHRRAFCFPEHEVKNSPRYERIALLLAIALMEAFQITVDVTTDPDHAQVEDFVLGGEAIVANWLRAPSVWYVDASAPPSRRAVYREIAAAAASHSIINQPTAARRLEALAGYLNIPWRWFHKRCTELSAVGAGGIAQPRSRLLSTMGLDLALSYIASLDRNQET
ncbi:hypothetical protein [Kribbella italica]|uniref:Uncharacterized protein n=1 Tax=Kribbella italica TaxID=1540520 RepID=A0A7W9MY93_9ACTN|nr:hypothetical protein [Kribbella italica]MBB5840599.1 hypothetical protein [Kribbella italica]